jgi:parvulin-like peptidyl-prolyl isomerase
VISRAEYEAHVETGLRQRFYHGKIPEAELQAFREEMAQELIDRVLLAQEAQRRGLQPQKAPVEAAIEQTLQRYRHDPAWQQQRSVMLAQLRQAVEQRDVIAQLRQQVTQLPEPDVVAVRAFYQAEPDKFTTPERLHLGLIMLAVEAWAPAVKWQAAEQEAAQMVQRLRDGHADFAELARLHSSDASAAQGGDLGYVHLGMLAQEAQQHVEGLLPGGIAAPLRLLQGIAIFRLEGREPARLNEFDQVQERARGLLLRQQQQQAWLQLIEGLRQRTPVQRYEMKMSDDG